jgi:hypothetical protein
VVINAHLVVMMMYMEYVMVDELESVLMYQEMDKHNDNINMLNVINEDYEVILNQLINNNDEIDDDHLKYRKLVLEDDHL